MYGQDQNQRAKPRRVLTPPLSSRSTSAFGFHTPIYDVTHSTRTHTHSWCSVGEMCGWCVMCDVWAWRACGLCVKDMRKKRGMEGLTRLPASLSYYLWALPGKDDCVWFRSFPFPWLTHENDFSKHVHRYTFQTHTYIRVCHYHRRATRHSLTVCL